MDSDSLDTVELHRTGGSEATAEDMAVDSALLVNHISLKRGRIEALQRELDFEAKALARLERKLYSSSSKAARVFGETLGNATRKNSVRLTEFGGAAMVAHLACVSIELR